MNQNKDESKKEHPESNWIKIKNEWKVGGGILGRPLILLPLIACALSLYFATFTITEKPFSLVLNIVAAILAGVASGGIWDFFKNMMGDTILIKKGSSAVRNLSLARLKIKNISERTKLKATTEEIKNLLSLLEKDIANSLQEWNDILPGVTHIEAIYELVDEKENELNTAIQEKEELNNRLAQEKQFQAGEKEKLRKDFDQKEKKVAELIQEIGRLQTRATSSSSGVIGLSGGVIPSYVYEALTAGVNRCAICGKPYLLKALGETGKCEECQKAIKK